MKRIFLFFSLLLPLQLLAHPVIYRDGWVISSSNMPSYSNNTLGYSFHHRWSVGMDHWRFTWEDEHSDAGLLRLNHLLWRKNATDSQANLYLHSGVGMISQDWGKQESKGLYMGGLEVDWEDRALYTSLKRLQFHAPRGLDIAMTQVRMGFSPVIADFRELQAWFMLQAMHMDVIEEKVQITPMLRFFYHNVLWEFGSSTRGDWMLNLMVHY